MSGNQITISVNSTDFDRLRSIARTRGQSVADCVAQLVSAKLANAASATPSGLNTLHLNTLQESSKVT